MTATQQKSWRTLSYNTTAASPDVTPLMHENHPLVYDELQPWYPHLVLVLFSWHGHVSLRSELLLWVGAEHEAKGYDYVECRREAAGSSTMKIYVFFARLPFPLVSKQEHSRAGAARRSATGEIFAAKEATGTPNPPMYRRVDRCLHN